MGDEAIRWTVNVNPRTDIDLRTYLARRGMKKGDLSKFIEEAVNWRLMDLAMAQARDDFADLPDEDILDMVDEAVASVRKRRA